MENKISIRHYILKGHEAVPCENVMEWAEWFSVNVDRRRVAKTEFTSNIFLAWLGKLLKIKRFEPVMVSTVFLSLNHNWDDGEPLLFETMVFGGKLNGELWRCSTWEEAEKNHKKVVGKI